METSFTEMLAGVDDDRTKTGAAGALIGGGVWARIAPAMHHGDDDTGAPHLAPLERSLGAPSVCVSSRDAWLRIFEPRWRAMVKSARAAGDMHPSDTEPNALSLLVGAPSYLVEHGCADTTLLSSWLHLDLGDLQRVRVLEELNHANPRALHFNNEWC